MMRNLQKKILVYGATQKSNCLLLQRQAMLTSTFNCTTAFSVAEPVFPPCSPLQLMSFTKLNHETVGRQVVFSSLYFLHALYQLYIYYICCQILTIDAGVVCRQMSQQNGSQGNCAKYMVWYGQKTMPVHYTGIQCNGVTFCPYWLDQLYLCIWHNLLVIHFAGSSEYNSFIYDFVL